MRAPPMASSEKELEEKLLEAGNKLVDPPSSVEELLSLLDQVEGFLSRVEQSPSNSMQNALSPSMKVLIADELLRHSDADVKVAVASCISEITRITAPDAPYDDGQMKEVFRLIVSSFENLCDKSSRSYAKRTSILETVAKVRSCVVMLDLECDALILEMFQHFLKEIREHHPESLFSSMETIMTLVLEESEDISVDLLSPLLVSIKKDNEEVLPIARKLGERVVESCATKLKPYLVQAVRTLGVSVGDYSSILASICQDASDSLEQNDACATSEHVEDENKSSKQSLEEPEQVAKVDAREAAPSQQDKPVGDGSPKSVMSKGIAQVGQDDTSADPKSLKKEEDADCSDHTKGMNISGHEVPNDLDTEKVDNSEKEQEQATKRRGRKPSFSTKLTEPSEVQAIANEKEAEKKLDSESHSKDVPSSPHENHSVEAAGPSENDKQINLDTEKVGDSEQKKEQATKRRGRRPSSSTKLTEPSEVEAAANEKEAEKKLDADRHSKDIPSSPRDNHSVEAAGPLQNDKEINLDTQTVGNSEQKQEQATKRRGRRPSPSTKLTEPSEVQAVANEKEAEKKLGSESHSKDVPSSPHENHSVEAARPSENDKEINLDTQTVGNSEQKQEQATKRRGRKSNSSTKLTEPSEVQAVANKKEAEKKLDSESHSKEVPSSPHENHSVEAAGPSGNDKDINLKISSPKAGSSESEVVASPSSSDILHDENRSKKIGQAKTKDGSAEEVAEEDDTKKLLDGMNDSEAKTAKRSVKKTLGRNSVKKTPVPDSVKKASGATRDPDAKRRSAKKADESNKVGGGSSSRQPEEKKKLGRGEANADTGAVKDVDKEMVSSPRSGPKSTKNSEETPKTNVKRKHISGKENEYETKEYGENLVGLRVEVWWPEDREFYKGVIGSFDSAKKKHKVMYDDDEVEILNLRKEKWKIVEADSDSNQEGGGDHASLDASADMPPKKKRKTSAGEPIKQGKIDASSKSGGAVASSRSKGASIKSSHNSKDGGKSKDSKTISKSEEEVGRKSYSPKSGSNKSAAAAQKMTAKSKDASTSKTSRSKGDDKQETPKTPASKVKSSKSGGKSNVNGTGKVKSGLLKRKVLESENSDVSAGDIENAKGKTSSSSKAQGIEGKSGKKLRKS